MLFPYHELLVQVSLKDALIMVRAYFMEISECPFLLWNIVCDDGGFCDLWEGENRGYVAQ